MLYHTLLKKIMLRSMHANHSARSHPLFRFCIFKISFPHVSSIRTTKFQISHLTCIFIDSHFVLYFIFYFQFQICRGFREIIVRLFQNRFPFFPSNVSKSVPLCLINRPPSLNRLKVCIFLLIYQSSWYLYAKGKRKSGFLPMNIDGFVVFVCYLLFSPFGLQL